MGEDHDGGAPRDATDATETWLRGGLASDLDTGFADVVRVHGDLVYSVARNLTRRPADAEDLAADTLLRAYRALRGYDDARILELSVRPWLMTILRNAARNAARDASRRPGPPPAFEPVSDPRDDSAGPAERAERADTRRTLRVALDRLPEVQRTAVVLRHVVGLPTSEVAQVLGCKDGTAKSHISRGLQRLRALLTENATAAEPPCGDRVPVDAVTGGTDQRVLASGRRER
jgi:RNA polymerase sigma factor (sigma-70 family)